MVDQNLSELHIEFIKAAASGGSLFMCESTCRLVWIPAGG